MPRAWAMSTMFRAKMLGSSNSASWRAMTSERRRFLASSTWINASSSPESRSLRESIPSSLREKTECIPGASMILIPSGEREKRPCCRLPAETSTALPESERLQRPVPAQS